MVGVNRAGLGGGKATFVTADSFAVASSCTLGEQAAHHMRVLRLEIGAIVGLRDGQGRVGSGRIVRMSKSHAIIDVEELCVVDLLPAVHLLVPVADREHMLWLAEKACELACTSWRPVLWRRSRSVSPRGEGPTFQAKVRARMEGALAQSEGAWLPQLFPEANLERALLASPPGNRLVLDSLGVPMGAALRSATEPLIIALGPEGGIEDDEFVALEAAGFRRVCVAPTILRFETAGVAALAIARSTLTFSLRSERHG